MGPPRVRVDLARRHEPLGCDRLAVYRRLRDDRHGHRHAAHRVERVGDGSANVHLRAHERHEPLVRSRHLEHHGVVTVPAWYLVASGLAGQAPANTETYVIRPVMWDHKVFSAVNVANGDSIQFTYTLTINSGG
jgi:hypothetical protein